RLPSGHYDDRCPTMPSVSVHCGPVDPDLSGSKRYVVLHALPHLADLPHQVGRLLGVGDEVDLRAVDHEEGRLLIVKKEVLVRLRYAPDILRRDLALKVARAPAQARQQHIGTRLQVDDEVRLGEPSPQHVKELAVECQFLRIEIDLRKELILREEIVCNQTLAKKILLCKLLLLPVTGQQEEHLRLEG